MRTNLMRLQKVVLHLLLTLVFCGLVGAQDYDHIAPKTPEKKEGGVEVPSAAPQPIAVEPKAPAADTGGTGVLVEKLTGLVFLTKPEQVNKEGVSGVIGVQAEGLDLLQTATFTPRIEKHLGQPVTLDSLKRLTDDIVLFYRENDRPVVDVSVPGQDITKGGIQILIVEGRVGEVRVEGNTWVSDEKLKRAVRLRAGEPIRASALKKDTDWLNSNPFRQVNVTLERGKERGETDVVLKTQDRFPARFYAGYDDSGTDFTGDERWSLGLNWGDAFLLDHQLNYQLTTSSDWRKFFGHSGSYIIPLPWRHQLTFFGSYVETQADIPLPGLNLKGKSWQTSTRYSIPLPAHGPFSQSVAGGFDFKQSNNNLEFGGAQVFNTTTDTVQWTLDYNAALKDDWGSTSLGILGVYGPGCWTSRNRDINFSASRASAKAEYAYGRFNFNRVTKLPWDFSWTLRGLYQLSEANLLGSEQFGLGGYSTVRGYEEREANGDNGYLLSTEVRTPPVSPGTWLKMKSARDQLQVLGFFDYGGTQNYSLLPAEDPHRQLASVGPGLRYSVSPYLTLRFDYGWQLYPTGSGNRFHERGHLGIVIAY